MHINIEILIVGNDQIIDVEINKQTNNINTLHFYAK
jgi:hypothetical protein